MPLRVCAIAVSPDDSLLDNPIIICIKVLCLGSGRSMNFFRNYTGLKQALHVAVADKEGVQRIQGVRRTPFHPTPFRFKISYQNEIIWSQRDQIIPFSWDTYEKCDKISKANPNTFIHIIFLSRNPGSAP